MLPSYDVLVKFVPGCGNKKHSIFSNAFMICSRVPTYWHIIHYCWQGKVFPAMREIDDHGHSYQGRLFFSALQIGELPASLPSKAWCFRRFGNFASRERENPDTTCLFLSPNLGGGDLGFELGEAGDSSLRSSLFLLWAWSAQNNKRNKVSKDRRCWGRFRALLHLEGRPWKFSEIHQLIQHVVLYLVLYVVYLVGRNQSAETKYSGSQVFAEIVAKHALSIHQQDGHFFFPKMAKE